MRLDQTEQQRSRIRELADSLQTGTWPQTQTVLCRLDPDTHRPTGFCCLGVATEVAIHLGLDLSCTDVFEPDAATQDKALQELVMTGGPVRVYGNGYSWQNAAELHESVGRWYGFESNGFPGEDPDVYVPPYLQEKYSFEITKMLVGYHDGDRLYCSAVQLNDGVGMTLPEIGECFRYTYLRSEWQTMQDAAAKAA